MGFRGAALALSAVLAAAGCASPRAAHTAATSPERAAAVPPERTETKAPLCEPARPTASCSAGVCPPGPPYCGPGSAVYPHGPPRVERHGEGELAYWLYEPSAPVPASAPVVVYLHGSHEVDPTQYESLLVHLCRKGFTVVFPYYGGLDDVPRYESNARRAVADALALLATDGHVKPSGGFALAGHSLGGMLALRLAMESSDLPRLPAAGAVVVHDPAGRGYFPLDLGPGALGHIPAATRLVVIEAETSVGDANSSADEAWNNTTRVPRERKNFFVVRSDDHGEPKLVSDHLGVQHGSSQGVVRALDAIDWWGYWRLTEAAIAEALGARDPGFSAFCGAAGPRCDAERAMGTWSDGTPVARISNAADLGK